MNGPLHYIKSWRKRSQRPANIKLSQGRGNRCLLKVRVRATFHSGWTKHPNSRSTPLGCNLSQLQDWRQHPPRLAQAASEAGQGFSRLKVSPMSQNGNYRAPDEQHPALADLRMHTKKPSFKSSCLRQHATKATNVSKKGKETLTPQTEVGQRTAHQDQLANRKIPTQPQQHGDQQKCRLKTEGSGEPSAFKNFLLQIHSAI